MSSVSHSSPPADDHRPFKRARQAKDLDEGLRPYDLAPSSSARNPDMDSTGDAGKKNRKRPLSCGECRRCVIFHFLVSVSTVLYLRLSSTLRSDRLKLKVRLSHCLSAVPTLSDHSTHILQCDRVFPCQSCCKRGCAEICPDGALTGGKGSRSVTLPLSLIVPSQRSLTQSNKIYSSKH